MKFVLSTAVLASVVAPAVSFSYLDTLGGGASVAAAAPAAFEAPAAPEPVAAAPYVPAPAADVPTGGSYFDNLSSGATAIDGPGLLTHTDCLNTGAAALAGGPGINSFASAIAPTSAIPGGAGLPTYAESLSPNTGASASFNPFGSSATASFSGSSSADGVAFTLETGDISGLAQGLSASGGTLRLTGTIDNISYN